jgi:hypothetical protein
MTAAPHKARRGAAPPQVRMTAAPQKEGPA